MPEESTEAAPPERTYGVYAYAYNKLDAPLLVLVRESAPGEISGGIGAFEGYVHPNELENPTAECERVMRRLDDHATLTRLIQEGVIQRVGSMPEPVPDSDFE